MIIINKIYNVKKKFNRLSYREKINTIILIFVFLVIIFYLISELTKETIMPINPYFDPINISLNKDSLLKLIPAPNYIVPPPFINLHNQ
jgi:multisubunit Na+/H+ antiporter MnhB subunit